MIRRILRVCKRVLLHGYAVLGLYLLAYLAVDTASYHDAMFTLAKFQTKAMMEIARVMHGRR